MPVTQPLSSRTRPFTIDVDGTYELGGVGRMRGRMAIQITKVGGYDGSITVEARVAENGDAAGAGYVAVPYIKRQLNGSVADDSTVSTGITDSSLIVMDCDGQDVALVSAGRTVGSMTVKVKKILSSS